MGGSQLYQKLLRHVAESFYELLLLLLLHLLLLPIGHDK
jgi:hypothetical protein